jgi:hypothetical protein
MENKVEPIQYILIVTEDSKTLNIFLDEKINDLKLNKQASIKVKVQDSEKAKGTDPTTLISYGLERVEQMFRKGEIVSHLYCVMDVDDYDHKPNYELRTEAQRLIDATSVKGIPIISNEVSEIWYILHFRNETDRENEIWRETLQKRHEREKLIPIPDEQVSEKILAGYLDGKYKKTVKFSKTLYEMIKGKEPTAIENAKYLHGFHTKNGNVIIEKYYYGNPSSQIYILIEHLNELASKYKIVTETISNNDITKHKEEYTEEYIIQLCTLINQFFEKETKGKKIQLAIGALKYREDSIAAQNDAIITFMLSNQ